MKTKITNLLNTVEKAFEWKQNVPELEQLDYTKKLIDIRRNLKKILFAISEQCSTAAFGESQMGKSYLVSAILSSPSSPFVVTDGTNSYNFISEINPSAPNSSVEATGVITRFTTVEDAKVPEGYLKVQLLSVTDLVLILCEAYYNQVDYSHESTLSTEQINEYLAAVTPAGLPSEKRVLDIDSIMDIFEYLKTPSIHKKCSDVLNSQLETFIMKKYDSLSSSQILDLISILWNKESHINRLWNDILDAYKQLNYTSSIYARFDAVLRRKGTLLDVARLDEIYGKPETVSSEYEPETEVKLSYDGSPIRVKKSYLSALVAELCFILPKQLVENHPFLEKLDILDFPGARRPEQMKQSLLGEGKNLSTILRRGKVSYLFNKYSAAKRISTLLFCHNNNQSAESTMGGLLENWVNGNIGDNIAKREAYMMQSRIAPLFVICTWFNKDLDYQDEKPGTISALEERWKRRFNVVLEKEVIKSIGDPNHWFNAWTNSVRAFNNLYMLRDFKYSKNIYQGYNPDLGTPESGEPVKPVVYPSFFADLKESFLQNDFVKQHFTSPNESWESAAACAHDGTERIIANLNNIAPNVAKAREEKFAVDYLSEESKLRTLLNSYYHPDNSDEQLKLSKRQVGGASMQIDKLTGVDPYAFGRMMNSMMISESEIFEYVHTYLLGTKQQVAMTSEEANIFMSAGLDTSVPRSENIERLCDYFGVDSEEECRYELKDQGMDIENLLGKLQMQKSPAEELLEGVEEIWHNNVLIQRFADSSGEKLPAASAIVNNLWGLYNRYDFRAKLIERINEYMKKLDKEVSVGIISDYLSMQLNAFTNSFGCDFIPENEKNLVLSKNASLRLNIKEDLLNPVQKGEGHQLLAEIDKIEELLTSGTFSLNDKAFLARYPQYSRLWQWQQQMRLAYICMSSVPNYDVKANAEMKQIISTMQ